MYLKFLWSLLRHKWFVFVECWRLGIPWLGIIHDWTKFSRYEFPQYARFFYGSKDNPRDESGEYREPPTKTAFDFSWLHHQKANKHHWQYWLLQYDNGEEWSVTGFDFYPSEIVYQGRRIGILEDDVGKSLYTKEAEIFEVVRLLNLTPVALPMPDKYRRELLADWRAAGRAYTGKDNTQAWYAERRDKIILHPSTRRWIEEQLGI